MTVAEKDSRTQLSPGGDVTHMELSFPLSPHLHGCLNSLSLCPVCKKAKQQEVGDLIRSNISFYMPICFINWIGLLLPFMLEKDFLTYLWEGEETAITLLLTIREGIHRCWR